jgi:DNA repair photolyase
MAPILPGISDRPEQLQAVVRAAADAGASHVTPITLHLRRGVKEEFMPWLEQAYPELVADYRRMYRGANAPKAVAAAIGERVRAAKRRHRAFGPRPDPPPPPPAEPEPATQLSLGL